MRIKNIINNNLVRSNRNGKEVLVMGKGIGFKKKPKDSIDNDTIECVYVNENNHNQIEKIVSNIPYSYMETVNEIIKYADQHINNTLDKTIWLGLIEHIYYAVDRSIKGKVVNNGVLFEISKFYEKEYEISLVALQIIERRHKVKLKESEAAFIAMHLMNAQREDATKI